MEALELVTIIIRAINSADITHTANRALYHFIFFLRQITPRDSALKMAMARKPAYGPGLKKLPVIPNRGEAVSAAQ